MTWESSLRYLHFGLPDLKHRAPLEYIWMIENVDKMVTQ